MNAPDPRKALDALASDHGLPILRFVRDREWAHASEVAGALGIHTTTASKHLAAFYEAGLLERRAHPAKRPTFAYRLKSPVIRIEFDLGGRVEPSDTIALASAFLEALLGSVDKMGGPRLTDTLRRGVLGGGDWRPALGRRLAAHADPRSGLIALVEDTRRALSDLVGPAAAGQLVRIAMGTAAEGRGDIAAAVGLGGPV
jgi:DNA-binding transcriptional ArsR family regulator